MLRAFLHTGEDHSKFPWISQASEDEAGKLRLRLEELEDQLRGKENQILGMQLTIQQTEMRCQEREHELGRLHNRFVQTSDALTKEKSTSDALKEEVEDTKAKKEAAVTSAAKAEAAAEEQAAAAADISRKLEAALEKELALQRDLDDAEDVKDRLQGELNHGKRKSESLQKELEKSRRNLAELSSIKAELSAAKDINQDLENETEIAQQEAAALKHALEHVLTVTAPPPVPKSKFSFKTPDVSWLKAPSIRRSTAAGAEADDAPLPPGAITSAAVLLPGAASGGGKDQAGWEVPPESVPERTGTEEPSGSGETDELALRVLGLVQSAEAKAAL